MLFRAYASRTAVLVVPESARTRPPTNLKVTTPSSPTAPPGPPVRQRTAGRVHEQARNLPPARALSSCLHVGMHAAAWSTHTPFMPQGRPIALSGMRPGAGRSRPDVPASPGGATASRGPWQRMRPVGPVLSRGRGTRSGPAAHAPPSDRVGGAVAVSAHRGRAQRTRHLRPAPVHGGLERIADRGWQEGWCRPGVRAYYRRRASHAYIVA